MQTETRFFLNDQKNKHKIFLQPETLIQNKLIFNFLQNKTVVKPIAQNMWSTKFSLPMPNEYWKSVYNSIMIDLQTNKLKEYGFKLINAILPCKQILFKWKLTETLLCELCKVVENYNHLFIECPIVQQLWTHVESSLKMQLVSFI